MNDLTSNPVFYHTALPDPELADQHPEQRVVLVVPDPLGDEVDALPIEGWHDSGLVDQFVIEPRPQLGSSSCCCSAWKADPKAARL